MTDIEVVRRSKFRHLFGKAARKERCYDNIKVSSTIGEANPVRANGKFFAVPWTTVGFGSLAILPLDRYGKQPDKPPLIEGHKSAITDFEFSPFDDETTIVTGAGDAHIMLWSYPAEGLKTTLKTPLFDVPAHKKKIMGLGFHPTARGIITSASLDGTVKIWDAAAGGKERAALTGHRDAVQSFDWSFHGDLVATAAKDKVLRLYDPRAAGSNQRKATIEVENAHGSIKGFRAIWLGNSQKILTAGFPGKGSEREFSIWDVRSLSSGAALTTVTVDNGANHMLPFYDLETSVLYLAGKGDVTIRYYELCLDAPGNAMAHHLGEFTSATTQTAITMVPKRFVEPMEWEVTRFLRMSTSSVDPIFFYVPRKSGDLFQEDLFPPVYAGVAALEGAAWLAGETVAPVTKSLKPEGVLSVFEVDKAQGGKKEGLNAAAEDEDDVDEADPEPEEAELLKPFAELITASANAAEPSGPSAVAVGAVQESDSADGASAHWSRSPHVLDLTEVAKGNHVRLLCCFGQRQIRCVEVAPQLSSLNSSDVFVLDTGSLIIQWNGKRSTRIERAKAFEATMQLKFKDRGGASDIAVIDECKTDDPSTGRAHLISAAKNFWEALGIAGGVRPAPETVPNGRSGDEEEEAAKALDRQSVLYRVSVTKPPQVKRRVRVALANARPGKELLLPRFCYVLDTHAELFVWIGSKSNLRTRQFAVAVAEKLFSLNDRPAFCRITRVPENGENFLFKDKFTNFPEMMSVHMREKERKSNIAASRQQEKIDVLAMYHSKPRLRPPQDEVAAAAGTTADEPPPMFGYTGEDIPEIDMATVKTTAWRIDSETLGRVEHPTNLIGHFFAADNFIVLHEFSLINKEKRLRVLYYWLGRDSHSREKGATALLAVELDRSLGGDAIQVRMPQQKETRPFSVLLGGGDADRAARGGRLRPLIIHRGHAIAFDPKAPALYQIRQSNTWKHLAAVEVRRIRDLIGGALVGPSLAGDSYVLLTPSAVIVWNAKTVNTEVRQFAQSVAEELRELSGLGAFPINTIEECSGLPDPVEFGQYLTDSSKGAGIDLALSSSSVVTSLTDLPRTESINDLGAAEEATEPAPSAAFASEDFAQIVVTPPTDAEDTATPNGPSTAGDQAASRASAPVTPVGTPAVTRLKKMVEKAYDPNEPVELRPRLFLFSAASSGVVEVDEVFDFTRDDLLSKHVLLLDAMDAVYIWFGERSLEQEKKVALETSFEYVSQDPNAIRRPSAPLPMYVVKEGNEPLAFRRQFHGWGALRPPAPARKGAPPPPTPSEEECQLLPATAVFEEYSRQVYSYEDLMADPLPKGVDPTKLETYLSDEEFAKVFGMTREAWNKLPPWKTEPLKREVGLF